jgi:hypothetical protein
VTEQFVMHASGSEPTPVSSHVSGQEEVWHHPGAVHVEAIDFQALHFRDSRGQVGTQVFRIVLSAVCCYGIM